MKKKLRILNFMLSGTYPPHLSPKAMRADLSLSRPNEASSWCGLYIQCAFLITAMVLTAKINYELIIIIIIIILDED